MHSMDQVIGPMKGGLSVRRILHNVQRQLGSETVSVVLNSGLDNISFII